MDYYYTARQLELTAIVGKAYIFSSDEEANFIFKWIKNKKNFKKGGNTIWKTKN